MTRSWSLRSITPPLDDPRVRKKGGRAEATGLLIHSRTVGRLVGGGDSAVLRPRIVFRFLANTWVEGSKALNYSG